MSTVNYDHSCDRSFDRGFDAPKVDVPRAISGSRGQPTRPLHRISEVRQQQGASLRSVSRRLDMTVQEIRDQEDAGTDLRISELLKWQEILEVPLADLLVDSGEPLSDPVSRRASLLRVMKTAKAIQETAKDRSVRRMANMLVGQLVHIMPELAEVAAWHSVGQRRTQDDVGRIVERTIPENFANDSLR